MSGRHAEGFEIVTVSAEMTTLVGVAAGALTSPLPAAALLVFTLGGVGAPATLRIMADAGAALDGLSIDAERCIACIVDKDALMRLFAWSPMPHDTERYHLTTPLRAIALAIADCDTGGPSRETYRIGKSIELLCEAMRAIQADTLVPVAADSALTQADSARLVSARRMIDEHWSEKLTLDHLARTCGLNRAKLTRGFRELYRCTVAEAIAERRLLEASHALRTTDLPVSSIGYASGYLNNASFSRAFGRRFGVSPSVYRGCAAVAA